MDGSSTPPDRIYLIPGFLSPRWMLLLLARHLRKRHDDVVVWDYARVFANVEFNVEVLSNLLHEDAKSGRDVAIVAHSFGDWIARQALHTISDSNRTIFISVSPVIHAVPLAQMLNPLVGKHVEEIAIMADERRSSEPTVNCTRVAHTTVWPRWEWLVKRDTQSLSDSNDRIEVPGTHNSVLFQPNVWRLIEEQLFQPEKDPAQRDCCHLPSNAL